MSLSANEIQALATKAARGAGFPPGQAESYGRATVMHLVAGRDPQPLRDALAQVDNSPILRLPLLVDDILAACAAVKGPAELTLNPADSALAPSYAELAPVRLRDCTLITTGEQPRLRVDAELDTPWRPKLPPRLDLPARLRATLNELAQNTYVPASEASRLRGAGAGLSDND